MALLCGCSGGEPADETAPVSGESADAAPEPEAPADFASLTGNASAGQAIFRRCMSCHSVEAGENRVGPTLYGVVGRAIGSVDGFRYSDANQSIGGDWTGEQLFTYLENPRAFMSGTTMAFAGIATPPDRAALIAFLGEQ
jgi:cytochrome c